MVHASGEASSTRCTPGHQSARRCGSLTTRQTSSGAAGTLRVRDTVGISLVADEAVHVVLAQALAAVQEAELDHERASCHDAAGLLNKPAERLGGAPGREQVVVDEHP